MIAAHRLRSVSAVSAVAGLVAMSALWGAPSAAAVEPPAIDPAAVPPDGQPGPQQAMRQGALCTRVGTLPGTDYRIQPKYMDLLNLPEAWKFGRGAGVSVALIDSGVSPHPRLPTLVGGGDYIEGGDGDDNIALDAGQDYAEGGSGNDYIYGGLEYTDTILGGTGDDGRGADEVASRESHAPILLRRPLRPGRQHWVDRVSTRL